MISETADYEAISMLNVSATQELLKRIEALEEKNNVLKAQEFRTFGTQK